MGEAAELRLFCGRMTSRASLPPSLLFLHASRRLQGCPGHEPCASPGGHVRRSPLRARILARCCGAVRGSPLPISPQEWGSGRTQVAHSCGGDLTSGRTGAAGQVAGGGVERRGAVLDPWSRPSDGLRSGRRSRPSTPPRHGRACHRGVSQASCHDEDGCPAVPPLRLSHALRHHHLLLIVGFRPNRATIVCDSSAARRMTTPAVSWKATCSSPLRTGSERRCEGMPSSWRSSA